MDGTELAKLVVSSFINAIFQGFKHYWYLFAIALLVLLLKHIVPLIRKKHKHDDDQN